jgi:hypothetical protein
VPKWGAAGRETPGCDEADRDAEDIGRDLSVMEAF